MRNDGLKDPVLFLKEIKDPLSNDPKFYKLDEQLARAVDIAFTLKQPLLVMGEPGTGKTQLAYKIARMLSDTNFDKTKVSYRFNNKPIVFLTKTTSSASDLFYQYDAIGHFNEANFKNSGNTIDISNYIEYTALGKAIRRSKGLDTKDTKPESSIVLIDEVDKAPRDFTNDLLDEIENMRFRVKETGNEFELAGSDQRILIIITNNSEKNLPEAFLRRCIFYYIEFPDNTEKLFEIVKPRLQTWLEGNTLNSVKYSIEDIYDKVMQSIDYFLEIRHQVEKKKPATAELLAWLEMLEVEDFFIGNVDFKNLSSKKKNILEFSLSILIKSSNDLIEAKEQLKKIN